MRNTTGTGWYQVSDASRAEDFGEQLSPVDLIELESLRTTSNCPPNTTLFVEQESPDTVFFLLTGRVKLSMNSSAGRRVILGIALPGETLGLASVVTGSRYESTAETVSPCMIASSERERYLKFLTRHPSAYGNVARELCLEYVRACEKVRRLGLAVTASAKLVLFSWTTAPWARRQSPALVYSARSPTERSASVSASLARQSLAFSVTSKAGNYWKHEVPL